MNQIGTTGVRKRTSKFAPSHGAIVFLAQHWTLLLCQHQPPESNSKNQSGVFGYVGRDGVELRSTGRLGQLSLHGPWR